MTLHDALGVHVEFAEETVLAGHAQFHRSRGTLTSTTFQYNESSYRSRVDEDLALRYPLDTAS